MTNSRVPDEAIDLIAQWEGFVPTPYQDVVGVWTIGYGTTVIDGVPVGPDTPPVSEYEARELMRVYLEGSANVIDGSVTVPLSANQLAALHDFIYNLGAGAFLNSGIPEALNVGDVELAISYLVQYVNAGGQVLDALVRRRNQEADLLRLTAPEPPVHEEDDVSEFVVVQQHELVEVLNNAAAGSLGAEIGGSNTIAYLVKNNGDGTVDFRINGIPLSAFPDLDALK